MPPAAAEKRVLPPQFAKRLFRSSFATGFSVLLAARHGLWACASAALLVLCTSLNYWRDPVAGWRRDVDIAAVAAATAFHLYCASSCPARAYQASYLLGLLKTAYCYRRARAAPDHDAASAWHCAVHVAGNAANLLLYTGLAL